MREMRVLQVNNVDLPGRRFNGYDLNRALRDQGAEASQCVLRKSSVDPNVHVLTDDMLWAIVDLENKRAMQSILIPQGRLLMEKSVFQQADIVHYHLLHNKMVSLFDMPELFRRKPAVWTWHDPWAVTGHCIHPIDCRGWLTGCSPCPKLQEQFNLPYDTVGQLWKIKKRVYEQCDVDIIVSGKFMLDFAMNSPLGRCFKRVHVIPFGIQIENYGSNTLEQARKDLGIGKDAFVIAFRCEENEYKGCRYIYEALLKIHDRKGIVLLTNGLGKLPEKIKKSFICLELGWIDDLARLSDYYSACNVFLMPSIAESFGLMAVEAMASSRPVICFDQTALPSVTHAPECGIAVPKGDTDGLMEAIQKLRNNPGEASVRGELGRKTVIENYRFEDYVRKHIELYTEILDRRKTR